MKLSASMKTEILCLSQPEAVSESQFQLLVTGFAKEQGWLVYHTHDSRRSDPGFPDLVLVRGERLIFAELKAERGRLSPDQVVWIAALRATNLAVYVWRPQDWPEIKKLLASKHQPS